MSIQKKLNRRVKTRKKTLKLLPAVLPKAGKQMITGDGINGYLEGILSEALMCTDPSDLLVFLEGNFERFLAELRELKRSVQRKPLQKALDFLVVCAYRADLQTIDKFLLSPAILDVLNSILQDGGGVFPIPIRVKVLEYYSNLSLENYTVRNRVVESSPGIFDVAVRMEMELGSSPRFRDAVIYSISVMTMKNPLLDDRSIYRTVSGTLINYWLTCKNKDHIFYVVTSSLKYHAQVPHIFDGLYPSLVDVAFGEIFARFKFFSTDLVAETLEFAAVLTVNSRDFVDALAKGGTDHLYSLFQMVSSTIKLQKQYKILNGCLLILKELVESHSSIPEIRGLGSEILDLVYSIVEGSSMFRRDTLKLAVRIVLGYLRNASRDGTTTEISSVRMWIEGRGVLGTLNALGEYSNISDPELGKEIQTALSSFSVSDVFSDLCAEYGIGGGNRQ